MKHLLIVLALFLTKAAHCDENGPPMTNKDIQQVNYSFLPTKHRKSIEELSNSKQLSASLKNPTKVAILFDCSSYCIQLAEVFAQKYQEEINYSLMVKTNPSESRPKKRDKFEEENYYREKFKSSELVLKDNILFFALQKESKLPRYLDDDSKVKTKKIEKFSRHLDDEDRLFKEVSDEILLPLYGDQWSVDARGGLGMASQSQSSSQDVQSELSSSPHIEFFVESKGVLPWNLNLYDYEIKFRPKLSFFSSLSEVSSSDDTKTMETQKLSLGMESLTAYGSKHFLGLGIQYNIESTSVANENFLGFSYQANKMMLGLLWYYRWIKLSYYQGVSGAVTDSEDFRGQAELSSSTEISLELCPFSYRYLNFIMFPCVLAQQEQENIYSPGTNSSSLLDVETNSKKTRSRIMIFFDFRQNLQGDVL